MVTQVIELTALAGATAAVRGAIIDRSPGADSRWRRMQPQSHRLRRTLRGRQVVDASRHRQRRPDGAFGDRLRGAQRAGVRSQGKIEISPFLIWVNFRPDSGIRRFRTPRAAWDA